MSGVRVATAAARVADGCGGGGRMIAWRAHSLGGVSEARLETARRPALRSPSDVLVRVHSSSINPLDIAMLGGYGRRALGAWRRADEALAGAGAGVWAGGAQGGDVAADGLPLIVGRDFAGEVVRAGPAARAQVGERVWGVSPPHRAGAHAQYVLVHDHCVAPLPSTMQSVESGGGGALYCALTALSSLSAAGLGADAGSRSVAEGAAGCGRVLVLGAGGVAQAALQVLRARGYQPLCACSGAAEETVRALGALHVIDRHAPDYEKQLEECGPYEVILDAAGLGGGAAAGRRWRFARYVTLSSPALRETDAAGLCAGAFLSAAALLAQNYQVARKATATATVGPGPGAGAGGLPPHVRWAFFTPSREGIQLITRLAERGQLVVCVEAVFPWWRADEGYARLAAPGGSRRGKLILDFTATPPPDLPALAAQPAQPAQPALH